MSQTMREALKEAKIALQEAELLLHQACTKCDLRIIDNGDGSWVSVSDAADRMDAAIDVVNAALSAPSSEQAQQGAPEGWKWMTHPDWSGGRPIPVRFFTEDGITYYQPFDEGTTEFEWLERDTEWKEVASRPAATAPAVGVTDEQIDSVFRFYNSLMSPKTVEANRAAVRALLTFAGAAQGAEPAGWLYVMHMEGGQTNKSFSEERYDFPTHSPFGRRGRDYSEEYEVTEHPICIAASPQPPTGTEKKE